MSHTKRCVRAPPLKRCPSNVTDRLRVLTFCCVCVCVCSVCVCVRSVCCCLQLNGLLLSRRGVVTGADGERSAVRVCSSCDTALYEQHTPKFRSIKPDHTAANALPEDGVWNAIVQDATDPNLITTAPAAAMDAAAAAYKLFPFCLCPKHQGARGTVSGPVRGGSAFTLAF